MLMSSVNAPNTRVQPNTPFGASGSGQGYTPQAMSHGRRRLRMEQVQEAKEKVQEASGQAKGRVREGLGRRGKDRPAQLAERVADRAERVGGYLERSDADRILGDVEDFGRRQ